MFKFLFIRRVFWEFVEDITARQNIIEKRVAAVEERMEVFQAETIQKIMSLESGISDKSENDAWTVATDDRLNQLETAIATAQAEVDQIRGGLTRATVRPKNLAKNVAKKNRKEGLGLWTPPR